MKKIAGILMGAMMAVAMSANADPLLYWMVDQSSTAADDRVPFEIARVAYTGTGDSGYLNLVDENGTTSQAIYGTDGSTSATWADLSGYTDGSYSFYVELFSWNSDSQQWLSMGQSSAWSYSDLQSNGSVLASSLSIGTASLTAWAPTVNIPEPSGGLLFLVGGSLLALRRRRKAE